MALLRVENLSVSIGGKSIVDRVDFGLDAGRVLGIVGESGSGKSMTAYALMRLLPAGAHLTGRIDFAGQSLTTLSEASMCDIRGRDIGMVFQEPMTALNPLHCIGDQISETLRIHKSVSRKEARRVMLETLEKVELPADQFSPSRYPHELSGGQRQRVVIAMAVAHQPRLLIADEPTTALDVTTQAQVLRLLNRLVNEYRMAMILISHDLAVVADNADDIAVMRNGRVVEYNTASQVFSNTVHPYTQNLLRASSHVPHKPALQSSATHKAPLLQVKNVVRDYQLTRRGWFGKSASFRAVDDVSFHIERGENVGLVGESGCGKSTLARAILGLEPCQSGSVLLDAKPVHVSMSLAQRRKIQAVFQDPYSSFNPRYRVARLIAEPLHALATGLSSKETEEAVTDVLLRVGLHNSDAEKYIHEFSGGQRQRIAIARALINRPSLIVLDEAVSALDVSVRAQILDLLAEVSADFDIAYLFISHDLSVVESVTDRVIVMKSGKIVEQGQTPEVFKNPQHPYTQSLLDAVPKLPPDVVQYL